MRSHRLTRVLAGALLSAALFTLALVAPAGAQFDYTNQTSVVLEDPGTGASAALTVVSASYGWDTLEVQTAPTTQTQNFDRLRISLPGAELGPGVLVQFIDPATGGVLEQSGGVPIGAGTSELVVPIAGTLRSSFVVRATMEAFIASAPTTTTVVRTTIITTTAAPTTTEAPTTTTVATTVATTADDTAAPTTTEAATTSVVTDTSVDPDSDVNADADAPDPAAEEDPSGTSTSIDDVDLTTPLAVGAVAIGIVLAVFVFLRRRRPTDDMADPTAADAPPPIPGDVAATAGAAVGAGAESLDRGEGDAPSSDANGHAALEPSDVVDGATSWVSAVANLLERPAGGAEQLDFELDDTRVEPIPFADEDEDDDSLAPPPVPHPELFS